MVDLVNSLLWFLFSKHRCLVYTAFVHKQYAEIVGKLQTHGVPYRTRMWFTNSSNSWGQMDNTQYDVYEKKEDEYKAQQAIHDRSM
ncbi:MAG TPA: hypothetical protein VJ824_16755 [Bacillota bacterium]|nr:hypothetical protein [Bacillota bacterium]